MRRLTAPATALLVATTLAALRVKWADSTKQGNIRTSIKPGAVHHKPHNQYVTELPCHSTKRPKHRYRRQGLGWSTQITRSRVSTHASSTRPGTTALGWRGGELTAGGRC